MSLKLGREKRTEIEWERESKKSWSGGWEERGACVRGMGQRESQEEEGMGERERKEKPEKGRETREKKESGGDGEGKRG